MNGKIKTDYLKFIFHKTNIDLTRYNISSTDKEIISKLFSRIISSDNLPRDLYILSHVKELRNIGKYFIYIFKKIEDNIINYDNLSQNLKTDVEFIENEILNYLSNPKLRDNINQKFEDGTEEIYIKDLKYSSESAEQDLSGGSENHYEESEEESEEESDLTNFKENYLDKKNYLELIKSEEDTYEIAYELPKTVGNKDSEDLNPSFELPENENDKPEKKSVTDSDNAAEVPIEDNDTEVIKEDAAAVDITREDISEEITGEAIIIKNATNQTADDNFSSFIIKEKFSIEEPEKDESAQTGQMYHDEESKSGKADIKENQLSDEKTGEAEIENLGTEKKFQLSEELQEEINTYTEEQKNLTEEENIFKEEEKEITDEPVPNILFIEFENQVKFKNDYLNNEFDRMIKIVSDKLATEEERNETIKNIIDTSIQLEGISREMSLEIISNIYHTISLSFEKISEGKYDISQSTLNLFKKGLLLVLSLIRGDDYFGYKDILKSIENIRNVLIEEREKREQYLKQRQEKSELERKLSQKYPGELQRLKINSMKQIIKNTELNFNNLDKISGEYQIYEALRSLSGNLSNFKEIVKLSKELGMKKLVQLSEASYIFIKFLQNYRINPVTSETKEIFGYIIYNLKSLVMEKEVKDIDLFISYLNDPVKIFSQTDKKKS